LNLLKAKREKLERKPTVKRTLEENQLKQTPDFKQKIDNRLKSKI
jgi:hypothetical protein